MRFRLIVTAFLALVVATSALYLRWRPRPAAEVLEREEEILPTPATPPSLPPTSRVAAPALSEVHGALDRVFHQTLTVDQAARPALVDGDFNGDDVTDLAVAVRPRSEGALAQLNAELASWGRQDAAAPPRDAGSKPAPVKVAAGDPLLAVIHGEAQAGWRSPDSQGYLLKNAVVSGMTARPLTGVPAAVRMKVIRSHTGDVIAGDRGGKPGLVFWTGAAYVWADLPPRGPARSAVDGALPGR